MVHSSVKPVWATGSVKKLIRMYLSHIQARLLKKFSMMNFAGPTSRMNSIKRRQSTVEKSLMTFMPLSVPSRELTVKMMPIPSTTKT